MYEVWFTYGSMHEAKAYKIRKAKSGWFRNLVGLAEVYGDREYKEDKSIMQVVEGMISCVKSFNAVSRWRKGITKMLWLISHPTYLKLQIISIYYFEISDLIAFADCYFL
ncbi:MAG: hypothetical protein RMJ51_06060 [Candidatus Calescibacterium sp.]|nr:hypothetical protein [Candidatus Calescibacterium sp.]MDW8195781.1 hypothetical protein [Candidatus Calescibacterium sp.]